jgi:hypothetical protein
MLSMEQYKIIDEQLAKENASEFVKMLLVKYGNTVETIGELLDYIPKLAQKQLEIKQKRINQYSWGMDLMIGDRYTHPRKYKKSDIHNRFVMLLYTCKAHFVSGNTEHSNVSGKAFLDEFVEILKEKKEFDYTNEEDWEWIYTTAGGADWLESVIKQNIDSEFVKPKNTKIICRSYKDIW